MADIFSLEFCLLKENYDVTLYFLKLSCFPFPPKKSCKKSLYMLQRNKVIRGKKKNKRKTNGLTAFPPLLAPPFDDFCFFFSFIKWILVTSFFCFFFFLVRREKFSRCLKTEISQVSFPDLKTFQESLVKTFLSQSTVWFPQFHSGMNTPLSLIM